MHLYKRLLGFIKPYSRFFLIGIVATAIVSGLDAALAWGIKPLINQGLVARDPAFISLLPVAIIVIFVLRGLFVFLSSYFIQSVGRKVVRDMRRNIFDHTLHLPASFFNAESSGKLLSRILYDAEQVAEASTTAVLLMVQETVLAIGLVIVMFTLSWKLTLFFMVVLPFMVFLSRKTSRRIRSLSLNVQKSVGNVSHIAEESIEGYEVIRIFGGEAYEKNKFAAATEINCRQEMSIVKINSLSTGLMQVIISIAIAATLIMATLPSMAVSAGTFAALITSMFILLRPVRRINQTSSLIQKGLAGAQNIFELLDTPREKDSGSRSLAASRGEIRFDGVQFAYPGTENIVLHDISFKVNAGETVAIVGRSGSGKSTLVSLLPRFYDVTRGRIFLDGVNLQDYSLSDLRSQFSLVSQNITLFNDTIAKNIDYGNEGTLSEADVIKAADAAHALGFIREFPDQLDTVVGENGVLLSGGERQRIAIARALLKNAPILILDEATSALDNESEGYIQDALDKLMKNRTTFVIAHRLSTIEKADRILVIDCGRIVETGTHRQLIEEDGFYARLYHTQFSRNAILEPQ